MSRVGHKLEFPKIRAPIVGIISEGHPGNMDLQFTETARSDSRLRARVCFRVAQGLGFGCLSCSLRLAVDYRCADLRAPKFLFRSFRVSRLQLELGWRYPTHSQRPGPSSACKFSLEGLDLAGLGFGWMEGFRGWGCRSLLPPRWLLVSVLNPESY